MHSGGEGTGDDGVVEVVLVLEPDPEVDREVHERLTRQVRAEIAELDIESVSTLAAETAPAGAKGADPVTLGALVVALSASGGVFTALIETLRDWLGRHTGRHRISVTIGGDTIELDRASSAQQRQLVEAYLRRHRLE
jgi:hypothetical protein